MSGTATSCKTLKWSNLTGGFSNYLMPKGWQGQIPVFGDYVWTDGTNIYYSQNDDQYVLNGNTWEKKTWNNPPNGCYIWTDGTKIYYSSGTDQYVLNGDTWEAKTWNGLTDFFPDIWTDGTNIYFSNGIIGQYVLNGDTWVKKDWGVTSLLIPWTDGTNIYSSNGNTQLVLNKETDTWETKTWNGLTSLDGDNVWSDGTNIYYSYSNSNFVLNKETDTWENVTFKGGKIMSGERMWTDGVNIYHSSGTNDSQCILLPTTAKLYSRVCGKWAKAYDLGGNI